MCENYSTRYPYVQVNAPSKTWIQEAKDESKWNALVSDRWESVEDEDDEDEDQQTESETEIYTTQKATSLEEEDEHTTNVFILTKMNVLTDASLKTISRLLLR
jgi:hypothetical protein